MGIYLGNLSLENIEDRLQFKLTEEEKEELNKYRCQHADIEKDTWHCFDIPFLIYCNGKAFDVVMKIFGKHQKEFKGQIQVGKE